MKRRTETEQAFLNFNALVEQHMGFCFLPAFQALVNDDIREGLRNRAERYFGHGSPS